MRRRRLETVMVVVTVLCAGFRAWGREMNKDVSPIEAGLMPFVRMKKKVHTINIFVDTCIVTCVVTRVLTRVLSRVFSQANFIGKSAVSAQLQTPAARCVAFLR